MLVIVNLDQTATIEHKVIDGIDYLIAPVVMATEGVMNGVLYPGEVLSRNLETWQGVPVPLGAHPMAGEVYISAKEPTIVAGNPAILWNPYYSNNSLKAEVWIDTQRANALGGGPAEAVKRLEAGQVIEVSTGLFSETRAELGSFEGEYYSEVAETVSGDHLAILLGEPGACSVNDGCGIPRTNRKEDLMKVNIELALTDQDMLVWESWNKQKGFDEGSLRDIFADRVIVKNDGLLFQFGYSINDEGVVTFDDEPVQVDYQIISNKWLASLKGELINLFKGVNVNKLDLLKSLAGSTGLATESLDKLELDELEILAANQTQEPDASTAPTWATELVGKFSALENVVTGLESSLKVSGDKERAVLTAQVAAHTGLAETELSTLSLEALKKLIPADYTGLGAGLAEPSDEWVAYESVNGKESK